MKATKFDEKFDNNESVIDYFVRKTKNKDKLLWYNYI